MGPLEEYAQQKTKYREHKYRGQANNIRQSENMNLDEAIKAINTRADKEGEITTNQPHSTFLENLKTVLIEKETSFTEYITGTPKDEYDHNRVIAMQKNIDDYVCMFQDQFDTEAPNLYTVIDLVNAKALVKAGVIEIINNRIVDRRTLYIGRPDEHVNSNAILELEKLRTEIEEMEL